MVKSTGKYNLTLEVMKVLDPEELSFDLIEEYIHDIPLSVETAEDMAWAGCLMGTLTNQYSYLTSAHNMFKIWTKMAKASGDKTEYENMAMRRDTIEVIAKILKQQYDSLSRLITIKQEINNELRMTDGRVFNQGK